MFQRFCAECLLVLERNREGRKVQKFEFETIAVVRSDYQQKFVIPRQPRLAPAAQACLLVEEHWVKQGALEGLEHASHLWIQFVFHAVSDRSAKGKVRPPRLGGNKKLGVFATRSTHRPNAIGLSVVRLLNVEGSVVHIAGADLLDGTPVLDIKPYLPWCDSIPEAEHQIAGQPPASLDVRFSDLAEQNLSRFEAKERQHLRILLQQSLAQDPRPAYQKNNFERVYGVRIASCEVSWHHPDPHIVEVLSIVRAP